MNDLFLHRCNGQAQRQAQRRRCTSCNGEAQRRRCKPQGCDVTQNTHRCINSQMMVGSWHSHARGAFPLSHQTHTHAHAQASSESLHPWSRPHDLGFMEPRTRHHEPAHITQRQLSIDVNHVSRGSHCASACASHQIQPGVCIPRPLCV